MSLNFQNITPSGINKNSTFEKTKADESGKNPIANKQKDSKEKIEKSMLALGALGAAIATGTGIFYQIRKGKISPDKINAASQAADSVNKGKIQNALNGAVSNIQHITSAAGKKFEISTLDNGKILVSIINGENKSKPIELPQYLYHVTSADAYQKIQQSKLLKTSTDEQLRGLYLLDSQDFLDNYGNTIIGSQSKDLISPIFNQPFLASRMNPKNRSVVIIKIPTTDLLQKGKIRVRAQEDFFSLQQELSDLYGKKITLRTLADDKQREAIKQELLKRGDVDDKKVEELYERMTKQIHYGYSLAEAQNLNADKALEYIFNQEIKLDEMPNIKTRQINLPDYFTGPNTIRINHEKIRDVFNF